jgi:hypothetical protein
MVVTWNQLIIALVAVAAVAAVAVVMVEEDDLIGKVAYTEKKLLDRSCVTHFLYIVQFFFNCSICIEEKESFF